MFTMFSMFPDQLLKALNRQAASDQDPWKLVLKQDLGVHPLSMFTDRCR